MVLQPRRYVHHGSILASGFIISWDTTGIDEVRRRVLDLWKPGVRLKKTDSAYIAFLPGPVRVFSESAVGEPLVLTGKLWSGFPLEPKEIELLGTPTESLILASAERVQVIPLAELADEDITEWIDTQSAVVVEVVSLGVPPLKPVFEVRKFDAREKTGMPPASLELQELLAELRQETLSKKPAKSGRNWKKYLAVFRGFLDRLLQGLVLRPRLSVRKREVAKARPKVSKSSPRHNNVWQWLKSKTVEFLNVAGFWYVVNRRYAKYLGRMVAMFESGDISDALRHAIPLEASSKLQKPQTKRGRSWFRRPSPRASLSINPYKPDAESTLGLGANIYNYLRDLYRQTFKRLEAQGQVEEAAFVLSELLDAQAEAVSFLAKHGRLRLAAEIAEAKNLSPAMAIRLWWLAKEPKRALALAIRTGELEQAVRQLSNTDPQEAEKLRFMWAKHLASSGKYLAAAEAAWPTIMGRSLAEAWWNQAIELGGTAGAIALARKAGRLPESFTEVYPQVQRLLDDESYELASIRWAFAQNLCREAGSLESQTLARSAVRSLVRDAQRGQVVLGSEQLNPVIDYAADPSLRADVPGIRIPHPDLENLLEPPVMEIDAGDVGQHAITDLVLLPNGGIMLALGESGILFVARDGRIVSHANQPASKLIISDYGNSAIGMAPRGEIARLTRIDTLAKTASYWCDAEFSACSHSFDGGTWCVANGQDVFLIDALSKRFDVRWKIPDLGGNVRAIQRNLQDNRLYVLSELGRSLMLWNFDSTSWRLRSRQGFGSDLRQVLPVYPVRLREPSREAFSLGEEGEVFEQLDMTEFSASSSSTSMICKVSTEPEGVRQAVNKNVIGGNLAEAATYKRLLAVPVRQKDSIEVHALNVSSGESSLWMRLRGSSQIALRFSNNALLCADDLGRVIAVDAATRRALRNLRV